MNLKTWGPDTSVTDSTRGLVAML